jgi:hypothetical protein
MDRQTQYYSELENQDKVYESDSIQFTAANPETKTLQLSPPSGTVWYIDKIRAWTDEAPPDNTNAGSLTDLDLFINGTEKQIAKQYATEMIGTTYRSSGIAIDCKSTFGQRLKITETTNGIYLTATKTGTGTHTLYLQVEGTAV